jgi:hypothetical protein
MRLPVPAEQEENEIPIFELFIHFRVVSHGFREFKFYLYVIKLDIFSINGIGLVENLREYSGSGVPAWSD